MKLCAEGYKRDDNQLFPALAETHQQGAGHKYRRRHRPRPKTDFIPFRAALAPFYSPESKIDAAGRKGEYVEHNNLQH